MSSRRRAIAKKTNPELWEKIKRKWIASSKAGAPGKISARKMQLAVQEYKRRGGGYVGSRRSRTKTSMHKWTKEDWGYVSKSRKKHYGRYLPKIVRDNLSPSEKKRTNLSKGIRRGKWVPYEPSITRKLHKYGIIKSKRKRSRTSRRRSIRKTKSRSRS
jgi:hypothetical protein